MGILIPLASALIAVMFVAGCYDPEVRDCTVTCAAPDECVDGQVCGADGFCAQPSVAGTCGGGDVDAAVTATLTIRIEKKGRVVIDDPAFTCESTDGGGMTCTATVPRAGAIDLHAVKTEMDFERWTTPRCAGQPATCHLLLTGAPMLDVGAKFH